MLQESKGEHGMASLGCRVEQHLPIHTCTAMKQYKHETSAARTGGDLQRTVNCRTLSTTRGIRGEGVDDGNMAFRRSRVKREAAIVGTYAARFALPTAAYNQRNERRMTCRGGESQGAWHVTAFGAILPVSHAGKRRPSI